MGCFINQQTANIIIMVIIFGPTTEIFARFEFTNLVCISTDKTFGIFDHCHLKSFNRTYKYLSAKFVLLQVPIDKAVVKIALLKRLNGYKPFLYNFSFEYCSHMRNPNPGNKVVTFFMSCVWPYSNVNHTCPFSGDLIVDKLPISFMNYKLTKVLPLPEGDYRVVSSVMVTGLKRFAVNIDFKIVERK